MSEPRDLPALREAIEAIDRELLSQLRRRMDLAEEVAAAKLRTAYPFRDEPREDQILQRVAYQGVEGSYSHLTAQRRRRRAERPPEPSHPAG